jgi:hypothetical protein
VLGEDSDGSRLARLPDRDAPVFAARGKASVRQARNGVHRAVVEAKDGIGRAGLDGPQNRRLIEAAGNRRPAVRRDRDRAHGPAVPAQLGKHRSRREEDNDGEQERAREERHDKLSGFPAAARDAPEGFLRPLVL